MRTRQNPEMTTDNIVFDFGGLKCPNISIEISSDAQTTITPKESMAKMFEQVLKDKGVNGSVDLSNYSITLDASVTDEILDESVYHASIKFVDQLVAAAGRSYTVKLEKHVENFEFSPGSVTLELSSRETPLNVSNPFSTVSVSKINFNEDPFVAAILQQKNFTISEDVTFKFNKSMLNAFLTLCPNANDQTRLLSCENVAFVNAATMNGRGSLESLLHDDKIRLKDVFTTLDISVKAIESIRTSVDRVRSTRQRRNPADSTVSVGVINDFSDIGEDYTEDDVRNSHDSFNDFLNDYFQNNFDNNKNLTVASAKAALLGNNTSKLFDIVNTYAGLPSYSMRLDDGRDYSNAENQTKAYEKVKFVEGTDVTYIGNIAEPESKAGLGVITILNVSPRAEGRRLLTRRNPSEKEASATSSNSAAQLLLQLMGITFNADGSLNTRTVEGGQLSPSIAPNTDFLAAFYLLDAVQMIENRFLDHSAQMPPSLVRTMAEVISAAGADVDQAKLDELNSQKSGGRFNSVHSELFAYLYGSSTSKAPNFSVLDNILDGRFTYSSPTPKEGERSLSSVSYEDVEIYLPILYSYIRAQTEPLNILLTVLNFPERLFTADYVRSNPPVRSKDLSDLMGPYGTLSLHPEKWRQMYFEKLHIACSKYSPSLTKGAVEWSCTFDRSANDSFINIDELKDEIRSYLETHDAGLENLIKTYSSINNSLPAVENQPDCREQLKTSPLFKGLQENPPNLTAAYKQIDESGKTGQLLGRMSGYDFEGHLRYLVSTLALFMTTFQQNGLFGALSSVKNSAMHLNLKPSLNTFGNAITGLLPAVTEHRVDIRNPKEFSVAEMTILPLANSQSIRTLIVNPDVTYSEMITRNEILAAGNEQLLADTLSEYSRRAGRDVHLDDLGENILVKRVKPRASTSTTVQLQHLHKVLAHNTSIEDGKITGMDVGAELSFPIAAPISKSAVDNVGATQLVVVTRIGLEPFYTAAADPLIYASLLTGFPVVLEKVLRSAYSVLEVSLVTSTGERITRLKRTKDYLNTDLQDALEIVQDANGSQKVQRKPQGTTALLQSIFEGELYDVTDESSNKQIQRPLKMLKKDEDFIRSQAAKRKEAVELLECYDLAGQADSGCEAVANKYLAAMKQKLEEKMRPDEVRGRLILAAGKKVAEARSTLQNLDKLAKTTGDFSYLEIVTYSPSHQEASTNYHSAYTAKLTEESEKQLEKLGVGLLVETLIDGLIDLRVAPLVTVQSEQRVRNVPQLSNYNRPKDKGAEKASFLISPAQYFAYMMIMSDVYTRLAPRDANYPVIWMCENGGKMCAFSVVQSGRNYRYPTNATEKAKVQSYLEFQSNQYGTCIGKPSYGHREGALEQKYFFLECTVPGVMCANNTLNPYPFATGEWLTADNITFSCKENRAFSNGTAFTEPNDSTFSNKDFMLHLPRHKQTNMFAVATYMGWLHDAIQCGQKFNYSSAGFSSSGQRISVCGALNIFYHILTGNQMGAHFKDNFLDECIQMARKAESSNGYGTLLQYANKSKDFYSDLISKDSVRKAFPALAAAYADVSSNANNMTFEQMRHAALKNIDPKELEKDPVLFKLLTTDWNGWTRAADPTTDQGKQVLKNADAPGKFLYCTVKVNS